MTCAEDVPKFNADQLDQSDASHAEGIFAQKHLDINDDPTEDILIYLKDACDWIKTSLASTTTHVDSDNLRQVGVLVHCTQGISRSGSIVVAYCKLVVYIPNFLWYFTVLSCRHFKIPDTLSSNA